MQIHRCFLALDKPDSISVMLCAYTDSYTDNLTILLNHYTHNVKINELFKKGGVLKLRETIQDTLFLSENYKRYYNTFEYMKSDTNKQRYQKARSIHTSKSEIKNSNVPTKRVTNGSGVN